MLLNGWTFKQPYMVPTGSGEEGQRNDVIRAPMAVAWIALSQLSEEEMLKLMEL